MVEITAGMFAVDLDGCLLPDRNQVLDFESFARIREYCLRADELQRARLVLCTGRPQPYVAAVLRILGAVWPNTPSVIESGAYLYYPYEGELRPNPAIAGEALARWRRLRQSLAERAVEMRVRPGLGDKIGISLFPIGDESLHDLYTRLSSELGGDEMEVTRSSICVDVTPRGVNKRTGVMMLAEATSIAATRIVGIGDSLNDLAMLEAAGIPACPANAHAEVKAKSVYVSALPYTKGVQDIVERFSPGDSPLSSAT